MNPFKKTKKMKPTRSLQLGPVDCGPANLRALCDSWKINVSNNEVRSACGINNVGTSIFRLKKAATELGLKNELRPLDLFDLRENSDLYLPAIVSIETHQDYLHYLTIHSFRGNSVKVMDPAVGLVDLGFLDLLSKIKRVPVTIALEKVIFEEESKENQEEVINRLKSMGISKNESSKWIEEYGMFHLDDCLKYLEVMEKSDQKSGFGSLGNLMRSLLENPNYSLPFSFNSSLDKNAERSMAQLLSPLVLVLSGPETQPERGISTGTSLHRRLFRFLREHTRVISPFAVLAVCLSILGTVFPVASGWIVDSMNLGWPPLILVLLAVGLTRVVSLYTKYAYTVGLGKLQQALSIRFKSGLLIQYQWLPEWMMKDRMPGELLTRLEESSGLAGFIGGWTLGILASLLSLILAIILMIRLWWPILALSLVAMVLGYFINEYFTGRIQRFSRDVLESTSLFNARLMDIFRGLETIRLQDAGGAAFLSTNAPLSNSIKSQYRLQDWALLTQGTLGLIEGLTTAGMAFLTYYGISRSVCPAGALISGLSLSTVARAAFSSLLVHRKNFEYKGVVFERCEEFMEIKPERPIGKDNPGTVELKDRWKLLDLKDITFSYNQGTNILSNLNLKIHTGSSLCLLGESGSGKSTLMDLLCGMYEHSEGKIQLDGNNISGRERHFWGIQRIEQEPVLIEATIRKNLEFGLTDIDEMALIKACELSGFMQVIDSDQQRWERTVGGRRKGLSGGEARRLCLARALLRNPRILLLDETLSGVDWRMRQEILKNLFSECRDMGILLATHDPVDAFLCDEVVLLENGKIVERGSARELERNPDTRYSRLLKAGGYVK